MTDTVNPVEAAQQPGTFDVLSFIEKTAYPTQEVVVFQDVAAADAYVKANEKRFELDKEKKPTDELDAEIAALGDKIRNSSMIFHLRGMPPGIVRDVLDQEELTDLQKDEKLIALTIQRVTNSKGDVDPTVWDAEKVATLRKFLKEGEFSKLVRGVGEVNLNAVIFDQATDAGFSSRGSDLAE